MNPTAFGNWGKEAFEIPLPLARLVISGINPQQREHLVERFGRGETASAVGTLTLDVKRPPEGLFAPYDGTGEVYDFSLRCSAKEIHVAAPDWQAFWSPEAKSGTLVTPAQDEFVLRAAENALRVVTSYEALAQGGAVIHSLTIAKDDKACLFWGASGAGKSTLAKIALDAGLEVFSDELNLIWRRDHAVQVCPLPFAGDFGPTLDRVRSVPLAGLFHLHQDVRPGFRKLDRARAAASMISASPFVNGDGHRLPGLLDNVVEILGEMDAFEFNFPKVPDIFDRLDPWSLNP
jgi:hypothetical protein